MSRHTVKLSDAGNNVPVVRFHIGNGQTGYAIIDTGSEMSIFDTAFVTANETAFANTDIAHYALVHAAGTTSETKVASYSASVTLGDDETPFVITAMSFPISHLSRFFRESRENINVTALLGADFLSETNANINFKTKEITLNDDLLGK